MSDEPRARESGVPRGLDTLGGVAEASKGPGGSGTASGRSAGRWTPWSSLLCLAILVLAGVLRISLRSQLSTDLGPRPDATEYATGARGLAGGEGTALSIDGHPYPNRYPLGVALVLAPLAALTSDPSHLWWGVTAIGIAAVGLTWLLARKAGGVVAASFAAFVVAISPRHAIESSLVMSEVPACAALLAIALAFLAWFRPGRSSWHLLWLGGIAGLSTWIRPPNGLVLIPMAAAILAAPDRDRRTKLRSLVLMLLGCFIALVPEWINRKHSFGSTGRTGYLYWHPDWFSSWRHYYNPAFLFKSAWSDEGGWGNLHFYARSISGWRAALWSPLTTACIVAGLGVAWRRRRDGVTPWFTLLPLATVVFHLPYAFQDQRLNVPAVPFFAVAAGVGLEALAGILRSAPARAGLCVLAMAGALFGIGVGDRNRRGRAETSVAGELGDALEMAASGRSIAVHESLDRAAAGIAPETVVISDLPRLFTNFYLPRSVEVVNLSIRTADRAGEGPDEEVRLILEHGLKPLDGGPPPRVLIRDGTLDPSVVDFLRQAAAAGRPIEMWVTPLTPFADLAGSLTTVFELNSAKRLSSESERLQRFSVVVKLL